MNRRSLFQAFFCATACAAMEVWGLRGVNQSILLDYQEQLNRNLQSCVSDVWQDRTPDEFYAKHGHKVILSNESQI